MTAFHTVVPYPIRLFAVICLTAACLSGPARANSREYQIQGRTMGTYYTVKFISSAPQRHAFWRKKIDTRLHAVNQVLSVYVPDSDICRFNACAARHPFRLSRDFKQVIDIGTRIFTLSNGAWDATVKPLVDLWGFGTREPPARIPAPETIQAALSRVGFQFLSIGPHQMTKSIEGLTLDLGSIAKGFGVDRVADLLCASGIDDFLVEIGGELAASGVNRHGNPWSVGISRPVKQQAAQTLYKVISLDHQAIATSGDYRNFHTIQGRQFSHIIDPRTGWPTDNQVVSASVIAPTCTVADGLATALMVMDPPNGVAMVDALDNVACLIVKKTETGFQDFTSRGFHSLVQP